MISPGRVGDVINGAPSKFGGRMLTSDGDPWTHNAWDNVEWDEDQLLLANATIEMQKGSPVPQDQQELLNAAPASYWDTFYTQVKDKFFKERAWIAAEFEELKSALEESAGPKRVAEIGCGNGSTLFPLLAANQNPEFFIYAFDYSQQAVSIVRSNPAYDTTKCLSDVWDLSSPLGPPQCVEEESLDIVTLIFVFSALHPKEWSQAVQNVQKMLKPGGLLIFRDYGRFDMAQLRFKNSRYMEPNLYVRGDGTRVYFFTLDEVESIFCSGAETSFQKLHLGVDKRLLLNRLRQLKMYRVWLQGTFRKSIAELPS
ncbi:methyltransferase [Atractiella rhizophila]|nr:methyltransferase [Atractiella rhizophila]